jgi:hypothetical protein
LATSTFNSIDSKFASIIFNFVGEEVGVDVGDEVGAAVLNIT